MKAVIALMALALLSACGEPRPATQQGSVCHQVATVGYVPYPWPDILRSPAAMLRSAAPRQAVEVQLPAAHNDFREGLARLHSGRMRGPEPLRVLAVSAGGSWGAFSLGFIDGWGHNQRDPRPSFEIVTGVSTGAMIAPIAFLEEAARVPCPGGVECPPGLVGLREIYARLTDEQVVEKRPLLSLLSATSVYGTAGLRKKVESIVSPELVARIAAEHKRGRSLLVMAVNLDSGMPEPFNLTEIAAGSGSTDARRQRIIDIIMASAATPIAFPPVFIAGNMYVDGGARRHVFLLDQVVTAIMGDPQGQPQAGLQRYTIKPGARPVDLSIVVSGDMKVMPDCTGKDGLDLLSIAKRTMSVSTDQLLRDSVEVLLLKVGQSGGRARFIDAASLVNYPAPDGAPLPGGGPCTVPLPGGEIFNTRLQACLDKHGYRLGQSDKIPWRTTP